MHTLLALLFVSLVAAPVCPSPVAVMERDPITATINSIINIAQITVVHIKKLRARLPAAPQIELSSPSVERLAGVLQDLGLLEDELQSPFTELLSQIRADVSSLEGRVRSLALMMDCPVQARQRAATRYNAFPDTQLYQTVMELQHYLEKFPHNKDKLKVC